MKKFSGMVFDETVHGTTAVYTDARLNEALGACDSLSLQAIADDVSGTSPTLTVQIEQSVDGRNWSNRNGAAEINGVSIASPPGFGNGGDLSTSPPPQSLARLRIQLGGTTPVAHVKVFACGRDR